VTAVVILHPALVEQLLAEKHAEAEHCRQRLHDITEGVITPQEIGPEFTYRGAKEDAIEAARIALEWAELAVTDLERQHRGRVR